MIHKSKRRYSEREKETRERLAEALIKNRKFEAYKQVLDSLREEYEQTEVKYLNELNEIKENLEFLRHEIISPLNGGMGLIEGIIKYPELFDEEQKKENLNYALEAMKKTHSLIDFASPEFIKRKEKFPLEEVAKNIALSNEKNMKDARIGLDLRYEQEKHKPIEIYASKTIFTGILNTLIGNALSWTPKYSRIEQGIRIDKAGNLEILIENQKNTERRNMHGERKGIGQKAARGLIKKMNGEFHNYLSGSEIIDNTQKNKYTETVQFGYEKARDNINKDCEIYGIQIKIPMKNLSE